MPVNDNLFARLSNDATLGPLVSNGDTPETFRIHPMVMPQGLTYPAVRYQNISADPINTLGGESDPRKDRIQIDSYSDQYDEAQTVANAIESAMVGTANNFRALRISRIDLDYDEDIGVYQVSIDYSVRY